MSLEARPMPRRVGDYTLLSADGQVMADNYTITLWDVRCKCGAEFKAQLPSLRAKPRCMRGVKAVAKVPPRRSLRPPTTPTPAVA